MRRVSARATRRCWAPSCRSRSMRRRSASAASMMRERASRRSETSRGEHRVGVGAQQQLRVGAVERGRARPGRESPRAAPRAPSTASTNASGRVSTTTTPRSMPSGIAQKVSGAKSAATPTERTLAVRMKATAPSGSCSRRNTRSFQVAGSARRAPSRRQQRPLRRHRPVGVGDHPAGQGRRSGGARAGRSSATRTRWRSGSGCRSGSSPARRRARCAVTRKVNSAIPSGSASSR